MSKPELSKWITANQIKKPHHFLNSINYYSPLTSRVEALEHRKVKFKLPPDHRTTDGTTYRRNHKRHKAAQRKDIGT